MGLECNSDLCYDLVMAKIIPVRNEPVVEPPKPVPLDKIKSIQITSEPQQGRKHQLQFVADGEGNYWHCLCGHIYPRPPMEVLMRGTLDEWLNPLVEEHERG